MSLGYEAWLWTAEGGAGGRGVAASSGRSLVIGEVFKNKTPRERKWGSASPPPRGLEGDTIPLPPSLIFYEVPIVYKEKQEPSHRHFLLTITLCNWEGEGELAGGVAQLAAGCDPSNRKARVLFPAPGVGNKPGVAAAEARDPGT